MGRKYFMLYMVFRNWVYINTPLCVFLMHIRFVLDTCLRVFRLFPEDQEIVVSWRMAFSSRERESLPVLGLLMTLICLGSFLHPSCENYVFSGCDECAARASDL